jgi:hypothetical protein
MTARPARPARPRALTASAAFGAVGMVLLLVGLVTGAEGILLASGGAAALSLVSALVWRSQLIEAWHAQRRGR